MSQRRSRLKAVGFLALFLTFSAALAQSSSPSIEPEAVPGEIIVTFKSGVSAKSTRASLQSALHSRFGTSSVTRIQALPTDERLQKVVVRNPAQTKAVLDTLNANPAVAYAEPNYIYRIVGSITESAAAVNPNDPDFKRQWGLVNSGQTDNAGRKGVAGVDVNVAPLWKRGYVGDKSMLVAVIDTGIDYKHPDLVGNVVDGGASFASAAAADGMDDNNHGTHCAGVIGAIADNSIGVAGVNRDVSLVPVKFLTKTGSGTMDGAVNAVNYAISRGVKIMSNSWGGTGYSKTLEAAIQKARDAGILFIAAAGNDMNDNDSWNYYPAGYNLDNVLTVAAITNQDQGASFTNYGRKEVDVAAPGVAILSTVTTADPAGAYATYSGTSMATPHVAGVAALIWAANPTWTYREVKERLIKSSTPSRMLVNKSASGGRINAANAMDGIFPTPIARPDDSAWEDVPFALESEHPYKDMLDEKFKIQVPGAKHIRVVFDRLATEKNYDLVRVQDDAGLVYSHHSGNYSGLKSDYLDGDTAYLRFTTNAAMPTPKPVPNPFGFKITKVQVIR